MLIGNIHLSIRPSVNQLIASEIINFLIWFENNYDLPKKVQVTLTGAKFIVNMKGEKVFASCFLPDNPNESILLKISTGDFIDLIKEAGKDQAVYTTLHTVLHEFQHYFQGVNDWPLDEVEADDISKDLTQDYLDTQRGFRYAENHHNHHVQAKITKNFYGKDNVARTK